MLLGAKQNARTKDIMNLIQVVLISNILDLYHFLISDKYDYLSCQSLHN